MSDNHTLFCDLGPALPILTDISKAFMISLVTQFFHAHSYLLLMHPSSLQSNRQARCSGYLLPIYVVSHTHTQGSFNELYVLIPLGGEHVVT